VIVVMFQMKIQPTLSRRKKATHVWLFVLTPCIVLISALTFK